MCPDKGNQICKTQIKTHIVSRLRDESLIQAEIFAKSLSSKKYLKALHATSLLQNVSSSGFVKITYQDALAFAFFSFLNSLVAHWLKVFVLAVFDLLP